MISQIIINIFFVNFFHNVFVNAVRITPNDEISMPNRTRMKRQTGSPQTCAPLSALNGQVNYLQTNPSIPYSSGTTAILACNLGFIISGSPNSICGNSVWSPPLGTCTPASMGLPSVSGTAGGIGLPPAGGILQTPGNFGGNCFPQIPPINGQLSYSAGGMFGPFPPGATVSLKCNSGFLPTGATISTCELGNWQPPTLGFCNTSGGVGGSGFSVNGVTTAGGSSTNAVANSFSTSPSSFGAGSGPQCLAFPRPINGQIQYSLIQMGSGFPVGTIATLICNPGFMTSQMSSICGAGGLWNPLISTCNPLNDTPTNMGSFAERSNGFLSLLSMGSGQCLLGMLPPLGSTINYSQGTGTLGPFPSGTMAMLTCFHGNPIGPRTSSCDSGQWDPPLFEGCDMSQTSVLHTPPNFGPSTPSVGPPPDDPVSGAVIIQPTEVTTSITKNVDDDSHSTAFDVSPGSLQNSAISTQVIGGNGLGGGSLGGGSLGGDGLGGGGLGGGGLGGGGLGGGSPGGGGLGGGSPGGGGLGGGGLGGGSLGLGGSGLGGGGGLNGGGLGGGGIGGISPAGSPSSPCVAGIPPVIGGTILYSQGGQLGPHPTGTIATLQCNGGTSMGLLSSSCLNGMWSTPILGPCTNAGGPGGVTGSSPGGLSTQPGIAGTLPFNTLSPGASIGATPSLGSSNPFNMVPQFGTSALPGSFGNPTLASGTLPGALGSLGFGSTPGVQGIGTSPGATGVGGMQGSFGSGSFGGQTGSPGVNGLPSSLSMGSLSGSGGGGQSSSFGAFPSVTNPFGTTTPFGSNIASLPQCLLGAISPLNGQVTYVPATNQLPSSATALLGPYPQGTLAQLTCKQGFTARGQITAVCQSGLFEPPLGQCVPAGSAQQSGGLGTSFATPQNSGLNQSFSVKSNNVGSVTSNDVIEELSERVHEQSGCPNLELATVGGGKVTYVLDGNKTDLAFTDISNTNSVTTITPQSNGVPHPIGTVATLSCSTGYVAVGSMVTICEIHGWSMPVLGDCIQPKTRATVSTALPRFAVNNE